MSKGINIYHRQDGRWEGRYTKSKKSNGKTHFGYVYGRTFEEVKLKLLPLKCLYFNPNNVIEEYTGTVFDWAASWLEEIVKIKIKESTYGSYQSMLQGHILPYMGTKKLIKITTPYIQDFVEVLKEKGLGANTIHNVFAMLNRVLSAAVKKRLILVNPCKDVQLPEKEKVQIEVLSIEEQQRLEQAAMMDEDGIAVIIALQTGMRIGEICGLRWDDIDFTTGHIHVNRTVQRIVVMKGDKRSTEVFIGTPKRSRSKRTIPMTDSLKAVLLNEFKQGQGEYVVTCKGRFAEPRTVRNRYQRIAEAADIRKMRFHGLRHTFATRCMESNIDIPVISRYLGHSSAKMTMDIYLDVTMEYMTESIRSLDHIYDKKA
ncbi:MAG: tyrosine-type recombinase/integrase [Lachnospiraceae bacterium]